MITEADRSRLSEANELAAAAAPLLELLPPEVRGPLDRAVERSRGGHPRVLILGQTNRGKSSLVNALFGCRLLPTGVLPLTSVPTTMTVAADLAASVWFRDGTSEKIGVDGVAEYVSERGNPSNSRQVDRVALQAPTGSLPIGTEVVDTPGTGSIHRANTSESDRARGTMDLAVLVLTADPPISEAELGLLSESLQTAARAAVVINKSDLVPDEDLDQVIQFTDHTLGAADIRIPIFAVSLHTGRGVEDFAAWLGDQVRLHGASDALGSTARVVRREADQLIARFMVEERLVREPGERAATTATELGRILSRARRSAGYATDGVRGEATRLRHRLDDDHERQVERARLAVHRLLDSPDDEHRSPEQDGTTRREAILRQVADRATGWFDQAAIDLESALTDAAEHALEQLRDELTTARRAAQELLHLQLPDAAELPPTEPPRLPSLDVVPDADWQELISSTIARHLPTAVRRYRERRALREWSELAVGRPFGRGRSALQSWLEETTRVVEGDLATVWDLQLSALDQASTAVRDLGDRRTAQTTATLDDLATKIGTVRGVLKKLNDFDQPG